MLELSVPAAKFSDALLDWYGAHRRHLPWRQPPGGLTDPYAVWLSEIMLQQTTVKAVAPYFAKFLALWPDVAALADAPVDAVMQAWAGLGYYSRARNLHSCAKAVALEHGGRFPANENALLQLPGIGPYTAAAIAAIAFDKPHAAVDGNVERVISRLYAIMEPLPGSKPDIRERAQALVPPRRAGDFAQAMMDLGATICTPRSPDCRNCPWTEDCSARARGIAAELPRKQARAAIPTRRGTAFWIERGDGAVLLRRRPDKGLLGGMMEIPSTAWTVEGPAKPAAQAPLKARWKEVGGIVQHTFTHFHLELAVKRATKLIDGEVLQDGGYRWVAPGELDGEALPTLMRKIVALVKG